MHGPISLVPHYTAMCRKVLRGTGIDDAMIECEIFGHVVIELALNGSHYVRALTGLLIVEDVIMKMVWKAFWNVKSKEDYPVLNKINIIQEKLHRKERCPKLFYELLSEVDKLHNDFKEFMIEAEE